MDIEVRKATPEDADAIIKIWWQLMLEHRKRDPWYFDLMPELEAKADYKSYLVECMKKARQAVLVACVDGEAGGFVHGMPLDRPPVYKDEMIGRVATLAVDTRFRRAGLGKKLLQGLESEFRKMGLTSMDLMVDYKNPEAQALYKSEGFYEREYHLVKRL